MSAGRGARRAPGLLVFSAPTCPVCDREVYGDGDVFVCDHCRATWDIDNGQDEGRWQDEDATPCPATYTHKGVYSSAQGREHTCRLAEGHDGRHECGDFLWPARVA